MVCGVLADRFGWTPDVLRDQLDDVQLAGYLKYIEKRPAPAMKMVG